MTFSDGSLNKQSELQHLLPQQLNALFHVEKIAQLEIQTACKAIDAILDRAGLTHDALDNALGAVRTYARVVLHFHPDRFWLQESERG